MITVIDPFGNPVQLNFQTGMTTAQALEAAQVSAGRLDIVLADQMVVPPPYETEAADESTIRVLRIVSGG